jgi:hypothetical protein|nr:MAG TPA_asm: hypothetical protein [Caudoviricetes sp.]
MSSLMTCSGRDEQIVYGLIQVGDFIRTSQIQLKYGSLMRFGSPEELGSKKYAPILTDRSFLHIFVTMKLWLCRDSNPTGLFVYITKKNLIKNVILE